MEFHEAANFLFDLRRYALRPGIEATRELLDSLDSPHERLHCVQIAGSNGKGSTARMVERSLREAGVSVGLYTSPHLDDVRERVRVDGRPIRESALVEFVETVEPYVTDRAVDGDSPTFFETLTALALWEFDRQDVDVAVLEVGIGGSLDATSVVDPVASAITSVTLEHQNLLGDTEAEIARDMASVAPGTDSRPLVTAARGEALAAIRDSVDDVHTVRPAARDDAADAGGSGSDDDGATATENGATAEDDATADDVTVTYGGRDGLEGVVEIGGERDGNGDSELDDVDGGDRPGWTVETRLPLLGAYQATNAGVAAALVHQLAASDLDGVADALDDSVDDYLADLRPALERGLRNAHWPGRFEVLGRAPLVVLDGAHNPGACERFVEVLDSFDCDDCHLVVGAMADKDHREMARALAAADLATVTATHPDTDRAEDETVVARAFESETDATVRTRSDVAGALDDAIAEADDSDAVIVAGSLYAVAEARTRWARSQVPMTIDSSADAERALEDAHVTDAGVRRMRGKAVHRALRTRVQPRQARILKEELLSLGGECAVSGVANQDRENVAVVMLGTDTHFRRLARTLDDQPYGLAPLADEIRTTLGFDASTGDRNPSGPASDPASARDHDYPWTDGTAVMGILNITPDSFHDGGEYNAVEAARERAERMVAAGVDVLDVGGESTRPGAEPVPVEAEIDRVVPVIEAISDLEAMVSIDTRKAPVARAALDAGADLLNDVSGLEDPEMRLVAADYDVPVVVMHSIETPVDPDTEIDYDDVVRDVIDALTERVLLAERAGLDRSQILVDPGLGFGKSAVESFELLGRLDEFRALGCPILVGHSHKSMFELVGSEAGDAPDATVAATAIAAARGADVIRVHDAVENVRAVRVAEAAADPERFLE